jgi:exopolyphosphatase/guanosine-5'-triphosphate,3'-diphosphate pyrophosphatase
VERVRITATSAARDATNRDEFLTAAERIVGVRPELLDGDEEGRLSFAGATAELDPAGGPWLIVDIGGGSTELVVGPGPKGGPLAVRSLDVGCVRLTERFLPTDPPTSGEMAAAREYVSAAVEEAIGEEPALLKGSSLIGLAGTVSCLAGLDQGLDTYDREKLHHHRLGIERVDGLLELLAEATTARRRELPGVESDRADVIVGGAIVLSVVMRRFGFAECLSSESDILDGLVLSTAAAT